MTQSKAMNTPSVSGSGSFQVLPLAMMLGNGSVTDFGASQCIPMGPCCLTRRLTLGGYAFRIKHIKLNQIKAKQMEYQKILIWSLR